MTINIDVEKGKKYYEKAMNSYDIKKKLHLLKKAVLCGNRDAFHVVVHDQSLYVEPEIKDELFRAFLINYEESGDIDGILYLLNEYSQFIQYPCRYGKKYTKSEVDVLRYLSYLESCTLTEEQLDRLSRIISGHSRNVCLRDTIDCSDEVMYSHLITLAKRNSHHAEMLLSIVFLMKEVKYFSPSISAINRPSESFSISDAVIDSGSEELISIIDVVVKRFIDYTQTVDEQGNIVMGVYYRNGYQVLLGYAHYLNNKNDCLYAGYLFGIALELLRKEQEKLRIEKQDDYDELPDYIKDYIIKFDKDIGNTHYMCGLCYEQGNGVEQDVGVAAYYYKQAAEFGKNPDAQAALGICYALGSGVPRNEDKARELLTNAAKQDNVRALQFLDEHPELKSGVRNISYHAEGDIIQGNSGIIAKDDAVVNRANVGGDTNSSAQEYKFCMYCGEKLPVKAMFCMKCGKKQE